MYGALFLKHDFLHFSSRCGEGEYYLKNVPFIRQLKCIDKVSLKNYRSNCKISLETSRNTNQINRWIWYLLWNFRGLFQISPRIASNNLADQVCITVEPTPQSFIQKILISKRCILACHFINQFFLQNKNLYNYSYVKDVRAPLPVVKGISCKKF